MKIIENIIKAIEIEKDGVSLLASAVQEQAELLSALCKKIFALKGKIVFSGIGKSAYIAKKLAASFSSTGTPSIFIHPTEAFHGDFGQISKEDLVFALSKSGNTTELIAMLQYCDFMNIPVASITSNVESSFNNLSEYNIILPNAKEACFLAIAPTTSTTMYLVLGDAIMTTIMKLKNFSQNDFVQLHPGGNIGKQLLKAKDIMQKDNLPVLSLHSNIRDMILTITTSNLGIGVVVDDSEQILGIVTDGDIRRGLYNGDLADSVAKYMSSKYIFVKIDTYAYEVVNLLKEHKINHILVVQDGKLHGIIHINFLIYKGFI